MKKSIITIGAIGLIIFSSVVSPSITFAEHSLKEIRDEREEVKKNLSEAEKEIADILSELAEINTEIIALNETLKQNEKAMREVELEIDEVQNEIAKLEAKIEERFDILKERAKSYQANGGNVTYLEVIFGAKDFNDFISRLNAVTKITDSDAELIKEQENDKRKVEMKLQELEDLQKELREMEELINEQKETAILMKQDLEDKKKELNNLVKDLKIEDKKLALLESEMMDEMSPKNLSISPDGNGVLGWPTKGGYISSHVGMRWGSMHKGIDIARTDRSTSPPILAAEDGVIESAGFNNGGYGNMVIIDHGDGLKTLYAHMATINVRAGQKVSRGDQIGVMGATGDSTGIHLHFEVHVNGSYKNPIHFLR